MGFRRGYRAAALAPLFPRKELRAANTGCNEPRGGMGRTGVQVLVRRLPSRRRWSAFDRLTFSQSQ